jgi:hypothetical protein
MLLTFQLGLLLFGVPHTIRAFCESYGVPESSGCQDEGGTSFFGQPLFFLDRTEERCPDLHRGLR